MARKDMSMAQFVAACKRRRFVPSGFLGYYRLGTTGTCVSVLNAGGWRRNQLAYLIQQHDQIVNQNGNRWKCFPHPLAAVRDGKGANPQGDHTQAGQVAIVRSTLATALCEQGYTEEPSNLGSSPLS